MAHILAALAGVGCRLVTLWSAPAWLAVTHWSLDAIRLADAMYAVDLLAWLTAWYHARLHLGLGEILEFIVNVQVLNATMEAGTILDLPETERARVYIHWHAWRGREDRVVYVYVGVDTGSRTDI